MEGKNILENELNYDAHKTLGEQDGEIVLNDSYSLIDDRDSLDKGSDVNRKEEVRRQRRERRMPRQQKPMKDVISCEKLGGGAHNL